jgi:glucose-1-phosphate adenylyltransferase
MNITALVLAGGRGKRMDIFCLQRPKPALPFRGIWRVIDFTLSNCVNSQVINIGVLVDYQRTLMADYLNKWNALNKINGFSILNPLNGSYTGTSDAVFQNLQYLNNLNSDKVLILAGDHIYKMDYRRMLDFHQSVQAGVTVGIVRVPLNMAKRFGTVAIDSEGRILQFVEKSSSPQSNLASMGIYIFEMDLMTKYLTEDSQIANSPHDFGYAILPELVKKEPVYAYEFSDYWQDIGTVEAYYEANMHILSSNSELNFNPDWPVLSTSHRFPSVITSPNRMIINSLISPGCVIKGYVENSVLSPGVYIGEKAKVINSVIMDNCSIDYYSVVDKCILDESVNVGKFCYLGYGSAPRTGVWDVSLFGKEVNIPSETVIGRQCKVLPGLKIDNIDSGVVAQL